MLRFLPDTWLEWLLRPFTMMDPISWVYIEVPAPDWRFAILLVLALILAASRRARASLTSAQVRTFAGLGISFYLWIAVSGNGRYFAWGLLLVGPLMVAAMWALPAVRWRWTCLVVLGGLQVLVVQQFVRHDIWSFVQLRGRDAVIAASPLRTSAAIFLTLSDISYSVLVPEFHPQSRWVNLVGQDQIRPGSLEFQRLGTLLQQPLPIYALSPAIAQRGRSDADAPRELRSSMDVLLALYGLQMSSKPCTLLDSRLAALPSIAISAAADAPTRKGFWLCTVDIQRSASSAAQARAAFELAARRESEAFEAIERRCPRYFPKGSGVPGTSNAIPVRRYAVSDTVVFVEPQGQVLVKYWRALNSIVVGTAAQVRAGQFVLNCDKLPGRYQFPWARD